MPRSYGEADRLPVRCGADCMLGGAATHHHVLCELNLSNVAPCPGSSDALIGGAVRRGQAPG